MTSPFKRPTVDEVREYCVERKNTISPDAFCDYYDMVGWVVGGKAKMKDWKAAVRLWERRNNGSYGSQNDYHIIDPIPLRGDPRE